MTDAFDIGDQMPGRVRPHTGMGPRPAASALIEQDDPPVLGVEIPPHRGAAAAARTAMKDHHRRPLGIAALLHIDMMAVAHVQHALVKRVDRREQMRRCALLAGELVHRLPI